jgi:uncharacterized protein involved in exopolysaccharide biosynthesis
MKLSDVIKILRKNLLVLLFFPLLLASFVYYKTRDEEKEYSSSFLVYTGLASGYNLTTEEHPRLDHNAVNNAFDNLLTTLKARETIEEVGIRLLVSHIRLERPEERIISGKNYRRIKDIMPDSIESKVRSAASFEDAVGVLYVYLNSPKRNTIKDLINSSSEVYGVERISGQVTAKRKDLSDMLEVSYISTDPGICQQTLQLLSEVFVRRYKEIKKGEINNVVTYFEGQTKKSFDKLKTAEEALKDFEVRNKIINFDEQTKGVSSAKQALLDNIEKEKLIKSSAEASVKNLESKLDMQKGLLETNQRILEKRKKLAELNYKIANSQLYKDKPVELAEIKEEADGLKEEIREIVNDLYKINNSTEGLPKNALMTQWLNNVLIIDESSVRLQLLEEKLSEYDEMYNKYAPMGSTLNRLKREIEVSEKEYLDQLNALNVNKQRQQNIEMSSTIRVVDKPFYPAKPKASKRSMLVAGAFFVGFVLLFALFVSLYYFDSRIQSPARAEQLTGLKIAGALPLIRKSEKKSNVEYLESSLMEQAISAIVLEMRHRGASLNETKYIMISSTKPEEGKSWCAFKLASKFSEIRGKVLFMYPDSVKEEIDGMKEYRLQDPNLDLIPYQVTKDFLNKETPLELIKSGKKDLAKYSFVLIEIPPLSENQLPVELVKKMDMSLLVIRADRKWVETDNYVTKLYRKACSYEPMILLNRVSTDGLKEIFGGIPKKNKKIKTTNKNKQTKSEGQKEQSVEEV